MDIFKRITKGVCGVAIAGILFMGCENFDGSEPFLRDLTVPVSQLVTASGQSFPLDAVLLIQMNSTGIAVYTPKEPTPEDPNLFTINPIDIASVGKITFQ